jgi:hypothetical protein
LRSIPPFRFVFPESDALFFGRCPSLGEHASEGFARLKNSWEERSGRTGITAGARLAMREVIGMYFPLITGYSPVFRLP